MIAAMSTLTSDVEGVSFFETFFRHYYIRSSLSYFLDNMERKDFTAMYTEKEVTNFLQQLSYLFKRPTKSAKF